MKVVYISTYSFLVLLMLVILAVTVFFALRRIVAGEVQFPYHGKDDQQEH